MTEIAEACNGPAGEDGIGSEAVGYGWRDTPSLFRVRSCGTAGRMGREQRRLSDQRAVADDLARVAGRDQSALRRVYDATAPKLFALCLRILKDRAEAEDVLQDVYVTVWNKAGSFDPERASPSTWLSTLARNRAIDRLRASGRARLAEPVEAALDIADDRPDAAALAESAEDGRRLDRCMGELDRRQAQAIHAAFFDGFTYAELAARDRVPLGTMKSWIRRGLIQLKECLGR
jgi:RNA polymerase sigma-70 factor (ECF subfamily)